MPAESQAQRGFLAHRFGPDWMRQHHFDNPGKLPQYAHMALGGVVNMNKSGIHINPAHKGQFIAKAKRAGKGVQGYAEEVLNAPKGKFDPSTRKQANFARNAKGFSH